MEPMDLLHHCSTTARVLSRPVLADRASNVPWQVISEKMAITRLEAIKFFSGWTTSSSRSPMLGVRVDA